MENVRLDKIKRFAANNGHNTRQAIPNLSTQGWTYFPGDKEDDSKKCLWNLVFNPDADDKTKAEFVTQFRVFEPEIFKIAMSIRSIGQRDAIELTQNENGFGLVDGFVRTVAVTITNILAEQAGNPEVWKIKATIVKETDSNQLADISWQKNDCRINLKPSDLARRVYTLALYKDESGKKLWTDQQIAEKLGFDKKAVGTIRNYRVIAEYCKDKPELLAKLDAGKVTFTSLLETANAKNPKAKGKEKPEAEPTAPKGKSEAEPTAPKKTRPRLMSYKEVYELWKDTDKLDATVNELVKNNDNVNEAVDIYREALLAVMQVKDGEQPVAPSV